jgi:phosphohistidine phosphatase SixA
MAVMRKASLWRALLALPVLMLALGSAAQQGSDYVATVARTAEPGAALAPADLVNELRKGGYVLYFRHAATDFSQDDTKSRGPTDCANQRNLTEKGREQARAIGRAFAELGIPVGQVLASPMCRTDETARLIFGRAEPSPAVRGEAEFQAADARRYEPLRKLLSAPVALGTNLAIISHGSPFYRVAGPPRLQEGEMAVNKPTGGDFEIVARVPPQAWHGILAALRKD